MSRGSHQARLCWQSANLVQCEPDEPSWTWTQIWGQARMPDYSLNWTARSTAIQGWQSVNEAARLPESNPVEAGRLSASSLPLNIDHPARMPDSSLKILSAKQWLVEETSVVKIILLIWQFLTPALADGFPLDSPW